MGSDFPKPEIRTVAADKIFDTPGRSERPSHVSWCVYECECVFVCVYRAHYGRPSRRPSHVSWCVYECVCVFVCVRL